MPSPGGRAFGIILTRGRARRQEKSSPGPRIGLQPPATTGYDDVHRTPDYEPMMSWISTTPITTADAGERDPLWRPTLTLWRRDLVRFFRQRNRVVGALATPIVFWLLLGAGLGHSFDLGGDAGKDGLEGMTYLQYFYPGSLVLILLFSAIFSTISVIEDRREGFLQGVLVAPIPRLAIVLGKVLGGASIATLQGGLFLLAWPMVMGWGDIGAAMIPIVLLTVVFIFVLSAGLTALGLCIAWPMDSTAGFHAVMNLFLIPMWLMSGAAFPITGALALMRGVMYLNPLTYGHATLTALLHASFRGVGTPIPLWLALPITLLFTAAAITLAKILVQRPRKDGLA
jgi:ABC-2 type transport system permease protein